MKTLLIVLMLVFPSFIRAEGINNSLDYHFYVIPTVGQEGVEFAINLKNNGNIPLHFEFPSSKLIEMKILDSTGKEVYVYSKGRLFLQALKTITVQPQKSFHLYEKWDYQYNGKRVPKGEYSVNTILLPRRINNQPIHEKDKLINSQKIVIPEENPSFRHIQVEGNNGDYVVRGEAKAAKMFYYSVEDGHHEYVAEKQYVTNIRRKWQPFNISIHVPKEKLPNHATLMMNLYERSDEDKIINTYPVILETFK